MDATKYDADGYKLERSHSPATNVTAVGPETPKCLVFNINRERSLVESSIEIVLKV
jgi:hypothetical protein